MIEVRMGEKHIRHRVQHPAREHGRVTQIEQQPLTAAFEFHLEQRVAKHAVYQMGRDRPCPHGERLPTGRRAHRLTDLDDLGLAASQTADSQRKQLFYRSEY